MHILTDSVAFPLNSGHKAADLYINAYGIEISTVFYRGQGNQPSIRTNGPDIAFGTDASHGRRTSICAGIKRPTDVSTALF